MQYALVRRHFVFLAVLLVSHQAVAQIVDLETDVSSMMSDQRSFISAFSGATPAAKKAMPSARSTFAERSMAADFLVAELRRRALDVERHYYRLPNINFVLDLLLPPVHGQNIVSPIMATIDTDKYVIVGAHYDSVAGSPGANDNATGVAAALHVASALAKLETRRVHFLIVFFDQEEDDSPGSRAFAKKVVDEGLNIQSMHNIDMIGWDSNGDFAVELDVPTPALESVYLAAAEVRGISVALVTYNSTDHLSFRDVGIDAVCLSEQYGSGDSTPHHHKSTDAIDAVNFEFLASTTMFMIEAMSALAHGAP